MFKIENFCEYITELIAKEVEMDDEKKSVVKYGVFAFIQTIIAILAVVIVGIIFNVVIEALIISFIISILRKSSGGIHASSPGRCAVIGAIISVGMGMLCKELTPDIKTIYLMGIITFIWAYCYIKKLAPVDSKAKPIKKESKRKELKKKSIKVLVLYILIVIINNMIFEISDNYTVLKYNLCIYAGVIWQVFSLTSLGHVTLAKLDSLFNINNYSINRRK